MGSSGQTPHNNGTTEPTESHPPVFADPFTLVPSSKMPIILKILKGRLPKYAHIYNSAVRLWAHPDEFPMYIYDDDYSSAAWIVTTYESQDYGHHISISGPEIAEIPVEIKEAFISTKAIDWAKPYLFCAMEILIATMIMEISTFHKGNRTCCQPDYYYCIDNEDALELEIPDPNAHDPASASASPVQKRLDTGIGAEYITSSWMYTLKGTLEYAKDMIERHPSSAMYIHGKPVSAILTNCHFVIGMLFTDPAYRGKGYALICMKSLLKELAREGYYPASCVQFGNEPSHKFHVKCGMKYSHKCCYVWNDFSTQ